MVNTTFLAAPANTTVTDFRTWGSAVSAALAAVGMVKTADTGQINWATVGLPQVNTAAGYEVWRFADTLQATAPVFFRVEYGAGAVANVPQMWLTVGKGSSGAGVITEELVARIPLGRGASGNTNATQLEGYASSCATKSCVVVMPFSSPMPSSAPYAPPGFIIERSRDLAGAATAEGLMVVAQGEQAQPTVSAAPASMYAIAYQNAFVNLGIVPVTVPYLMSGLIAGSSSGLSHGTIAPIFPWVVQAPGITPWQSVAGASFFQGDYMPGVFDAKIGRWTGSRRALSPDNRPYWGIGLRSNSQGTALLAHGRVGLMMLWEG